MTLAELSKYNGRSEEVEKRIYIGIAGKIYDVTTRTFFFLCVCDRLTRV